MTPAGVGLEVLVKATLILLLVSGAVAAMRWRSAAERHLLWLGAIVTLLLLPLTVGLAPRWEIALPEVGRRVASPQAGPRGDEGTADVGVVVAGGLESIRKASPSQRRPWWLVLWAGGALVVMGWHGAALVKAAHVTRCARPCRDPRILALQRAAATRVALSREPSVRLTDRLTLPAVAGLVRPVVLLPEAALEWSDATLTNVFLHELAHVRRADLRVHTLARAACALYWPHPVVWAAVRRLRAERERACDDIALAAGVEPAGYATCLLKLAAAGRAVRDMPLTGLAMARTGDLEGRLLAVLDRRARRTAIAWPVTAACVVAAAAAGVMLGGLDVAAESTGGESDVVAAVEDSRQAGDEAGGVAATLVTPLAGAADGVVECSACGAATTEPTGGGEAAPDVTLTRYRGRFLAEARAVSMPALRAHFRNDALVTEAVLVEVANRAAYDLWMMLDVRITVPLDSPRTGLRAWAEGDGRLAILRGRVERTTAVVSTLMGPLPETLPGRIRAALWVAGLGAQAGEAAALNDELRRAGAELEGRWAAVVTGGRSAWREQ